MSTSGKGTGLPMASRVLLVLLLALAALYAWWFGSLAQWVALAVFALPPLLLAGGVLRGNARARFWAGVLALAWFSHGVMVAWSRPPERLLAWVELLLAVAIVIAASLPGLRARFSRSRRQPL